MVEIIKESNPELDKNLFLRELSKVDGGVTLKITRISDAIASHRKKTDDFVYIDFEILDEFKAPLILNENPSKENEMIDATGEIIAIPFTLSESDSTGNYLISRNKNIFNILNYAMKEKEMIPTNNSSSIKCNYDEIKTALTDLKFKATGVLVNSKDFNDYYRLEVKRGE